MFWKTELGKGVILLLIMLAVIIPILILFQRINSQPLQTAHVEVASKRLEKSITSIPNRSGVNTWWYITFEFSDGSEKEFRVRTAKIYNDLKEGEKGTLSYKEVAGANLVNLRFISFEKDT